MPLVPVAGVSELLPLTSGFSVVAEAAVSFSATVKCSSLLSKSTSAAVEAAVNGAKEAGGGIAVVFLVGSFLFGSFEALESPLSWEDLDTLSNSDLEPPFRFLCC